MDAALIDAYVEESFAGLRRISLALGRAETASAPTPWSDLAGHFDAIANPCPFLGLRRIGAIGRAASSLAERCRCGPTVPGAVDLLATAADRIDELLLGVEATGSETDVPCESLVERLQAAATSEETPDATVEAECFDTDTVTVASEAVEDPPPIVAPELGRHPTSTGERPLGDGNWRDLLDQLVHVRDELVDLALEADDDRLDKPVSRLDRIASDIHASTEGESTVTAETDTRPTVGENAGNVPVQGTGQPASESNDEDHTGTPTDDPGRVLVLEPSLYVRKLIEAGLEEDWTVVEASDVATAIARLDESPCRVGIVRVESADDLGIPARFEEAGHGIPCGLVAVTAPGRFDTGLLIDAGFAGHVEGLRSHRLRTAIVGSSCEQRAA